MKHNLPPAKPPVHLLPTMAQMIADIRLREWLNKRLSKCLPMDAVRRDSLLALVRSLGI